MSEPTAEQLAAEATPVPAAVHERARPSEAVTPQASSPEVTAPTGRPTPEAPKPKSEVQQYHVIESGKTDVDVDLDKETKGEIVRRLLKRKQNVEELKLDEKRQTKLDRLLLNLAPETIARLEKGELTKDDLALSWYVLHDDLIQKSAAASQLIKDSAGQPGRFERLRDIPIIGLLSREPTGPQTQLESTTQRLTSEYTREIRFAEWDSQRIENELVELNQLRLAIEQSFFERGFRDPLYDQVSTSIYPLELGLKAGNRFHDKIVHNLSGPEGVLAQRYNGRTYLELWESDRVAAVGALHEANQRALTEFAREKTKLFLQKEKPEVDLTVIEAHAKKLEERPKPEDIGPFQEEKTKAETELIEVGTQLNQLKSRLESVTQGLPEFDRKYLEAQASYDAEMASVDTEIAEAEQFLRDIMADQARTPPGLTPQQESQFKQNITPIISGARTSLESARSYKRQLSSERSKAKAAFDQQTQLRTSLQAEITNSQNALTTKEQNKRTAENSLKAKQEEIEKGGSPEKREQASALRKWTELVQDNKFEKIIDSRYSQKHGDEYTRERLANIAEKPDGQIDGAERIREHIFRVINPADYNPALARKMLSDESIAKAILWTYQFDTRRPIEAAGGNSFDNLLRELELRKNSLTVWPKAEDVPDVERERIGEEREALERDIRNRERQLVQLTLPQLRRSNFEVGDLLRFMVHEGLKSAEKGNPYLEISDYYRQTRPELQLEAESIYRTDVGHTEIEGRTVTWDGEVPNLELSRTFGTPLPIHVRVRQELSGREVQYSYQAETNEKFLQSLQDTAPAALNPEIRRVFYDVDGNLRTELRGRDRREIARMIRERRFTFNIPQWITLGERRYDSVVAPATEQALDDLSTVSPELPRMLTSSVADNILQKSPQERLGLLRGLAVEIPVNDVPFTGGAAGETRNYRIDFDNNGNFWIIDTTTHERSEPNAFYDRRLETYRQRLGVQTLSPEERNNLRNEFLQIQGALGREVLRAQLRR